MKFITLLFITLLISGNALADTPKSNDTINILEEKLATLEADLKVLEEKCDNNSNELDAFEVKVKVKDVSKEEEKIIDLLFEKYDLCLVDLSSANHEVRLTKLKIKLKKGFNPNTRSTKGNPPIYYAMRRGSLREAEILISHGADIHYKDQYGQPFIVICSKYNRPEIINLLLEKGADVNAKDKNGLTILMKATYRGNTNVVKTLIENGAMINERSKNNYTALTYALEQGRESTADLLISHGGEEGYGISFFKRCDFDHDKKHLNSKELICSVEENQAEQKKIIAEQKKIIKEKFKIIKEKFKINNNMLNDISEKLKVK